jgi:hypothetical protein
MIKLNKKGEGEGGTQRIGWYLLWIAITAILIFAMIKLIENLTT